jgi:hypothetical protein
VSARTIIVACYSTQVAPAQGWNAKSRVAYADDKVVRYSILYLRMHEDGWYDEVRYDSHDRTRGGFQQAPHLHVKLRSAFKSDTRIAEAEILGIIETGLPGIEAVARR